MKRKPNDETAMEALDALAEELGRLLDEFRERAEHIKNNRDLTETLDGMQAFMDDYGLWD